MNIEQLRQQGLILFEAVTGSQAYGTATPQSDTDIRGVFSYPLSESLSLRSLPAEVADDKQDVKFYELRKFLSLAMDCNPNIMEMLFLPEDCIRFTTPAWKLIHDNRRLFISKKAFHTYTGYAVAQIKKARGQHKLVNNPMPKEPPKKDDFCWVIERGSIVSNAKIVCFEMATGVLITRNRDKISVQGNSKNLMHCVRLLLEGKNILERGEPQVRFTGESREYLMGIRNGKYKYEEIMAKVEADMAELDALAGKSSLPWGADKEAIDRLYREIVGV